MAWLDEYFHTDVSAQITINNANYQLNLGR